jgi:NitT/TauT family transport system substrate-binding protein
MKRENVRIAHVVCLVALLVCCFSCSRTEREPAGPPEKVTFAYTVLPDAALAQVATANGYYLREGLVVTPQVHQIGKQALQAVLDGKADFATVAETPVVFSVMRGDKISILATIDTSHRNMAIVARKDKGISAFHDLRGKRIATTFGTIGEFFMDSMLVANGISRRDLNAVNMPSENLHDALVHGDVAAISTWNPILIRTQRKLGKNGVTFYGEDIYTQTYHVVARQEYVHRHPENVEKLLRSLIRAEEFIRQNRAEAQRIVANSSRTDRESVEQTWSANNFSVALDQSLVLALEDESRWAITNRLTAATKVPNYLDYIYLDGLQAVKPDAVRLLR